jgi:hypothetical protein
MRTIDVLRATALASASWLAGCTGGSDPKPAQAAPPPAELRVGDLRIMASLAETKTLPEQVTRQYGIRRADDTYLLLVAVRRGNETSVRARVEARARTLNGNVLPIAMRETRTAERFIDSIGTFEVAPPDTLQFSLQVTPQGAPTSTLDFTREVAR